MGQYDKAIEFIQKAIELSPRNPDRKARLAYAYATTGQRDKALNIVNELMKVNRTKYVPYYRLAEVYFALNEKDRGFQLLEKAFEERDIRMPFLNVEQSFEKVRSDQRFKTLLKKMNFE